MRSLQDAIIRLLREYPFYGHLLLACRRDPITGGEPLGITIRGGVATILCNEPLFADLDHAVQGGLLRHVIRHLLHLHPVRRKERHLRDWDIACDLAVNGDLPFLPPGAVRPADAGLPEGLAAEEYYDLVAARFDTGNLDGSGYGSATRESEGAGGGAGGDSLSSAATVDSHREWEETDCLPLPLARELVRGMARHALKGAGGEVPSDLESTVSALLAPPVIPWRVILRQFIATAGRVGRKSTWMRVHRRFGHETPGIRKRRRLHLLVAVDVSDSTDRDAVRTAFAAELLRIARGRDSLITVLYSGSRIRRIDTLRGDPGVVEVVRGGGFTDLRPVFEYAREMVPPPAAVIYLTDGYGEAPDRMEIPTLWVLTPDGEKPAEWGVELRLPGEGELDAA